MRKTILVSGAIVGGAAAVILAKSRREPLHRLVARGSQRFAARMEGVLARMPENSPPRLIVSTLPRLAKQNEEILALLREQDARLRGLRARPKAA